MFRMPHTVRVVRREGSPDEQEWDNIRAFVQGNRIFFAPKPLFEEGDLVYWNELPEALVITDCKLMHANSPLDHQEADVMRLSKWKASVARETEPSVVTQTFQGPVGAVAGRDVLSSENINVSLSLLLEAIVYQVGSSQTIPEAEKKSLVQKIKDIAINPYVSGLTTAGIVELLKKLAG